MTWLLCPPFRSVWPFGRFSVLPFGRTGQGSPFAGRTGPPDSVPLGKARLAGKIAAVGCRRRVCLLPNRKPAPACGISPKRGADIRARWSGQTHKWLRPPPPPGGGPGPSCAGWAGFWRPPISIDKLRFLLIFGPRAATLRLNTFGKVWPRTSLNPHLAGSSPSFAGIRGAWGQPCRKGRTSPRGANTSPRLSAKGRLQKAPSATHSGSAVAPAPFESHLSERPNWASFLLKPMPTP